MSVHAQIEGLEELERAFNELPKGMGRNVLLRALRKAGTPVANEAKSRAPRGKDPRRRGSKKQRKSGQSARMGSMADSIRVRAVRATPGGTEVTVAIGPSSAHFYSRFLEYGTHGSILRRLGQAIKSGASATAARKALKAEAAAKPHRVPARPFLRPAWDHNRDSVAGSIGETIWAELLRTLDRVRRRTA